MTQPRHKMTDTELCALIDSESADSIGVEDYFAQDRRNALAYYMGEATGDLSPPEVEGRSRVVSKTLMDTVEWAMPCLMRLFAQDDVVRFEPDGPDDDQHVEDASNFVAHLFYRKNNGFTALHDAIKSALLFRMGVIKVWCEHGEDVKQEVYDGLFEQEVQALQQDGEIEIVDVQQSGSIPDPNPPQMPGMGMQDPSMPPQTAQEAPQGDPSMGPVLPQGVGPMGPQASPYGAPQMPPELPLFRVTAKRSQSKKDYKCEGVPPEEIRIARDCRRVEDARYMAHVVQRTKSALLSEGWPRDEVERMGDDDSAGADQERYDRHKYDGSLTLTNYDGDDSQKKITVTEAYIRVDADGDGVAEYRRILKAGKYVHENEVVDDHPFALYTPILMPYKAIGLSFYDLVEDLQRIFTALDRQLLDNAYLANNPRTAVVDGQVNLDDLLTPRPGGVVRMNSLDSTRTEMIPFVGNQILEVRQHFGQVHDTRSGVTEMNSSLNAESLAKGNIGSEGVQSLISQGQQRLELVARVLAEGGVKRTWLLLLKLVTQYQDRPAQMKINGQWLKVDPRAWRNRYDMTVTVGVGAAGRAQRIQALQMIGMAQEKLMPIGGASPENGYNLAVALAKAAGERQPDQFFTKPPAQPPEQPPPIEIQVAQLRAQAAEQLAGKQAQSDMAMAQAKSQADAELVQVKAQADVQTAQMVQQAQDEQARNELQAQVERDTMKMQNDMEMLRYKTDMQAQVDQHKAELQLQAEQYKADMQRRSEADRALGAVSGDGEPHPLEQAVAAMQHMAGQLNQKRRGTIVRDHEGRAIGVEYD